MKALGERPGDKMLGEIITVIGLVWFLISGSLLKLYYWGKYTKNAKERISIELKLIWVRLMIKNNKPNDKKLTKLIWNFRISALLTFIGILLIVL